MDKQSFTFQDGGVFHTALTNIRTALAFSNNAQQFTLQSIGLVNGTATGSSSVVGSSCRLTVTRSDYNPGPQNNTTILLNPCTYDSTNNTLTVTNLGITRTSEEGQLTN